MKQTGVEWLILEVKKFNTIITREYMLMLLEQAKEMEKEQIRRAFCHGEVARDRIDSMEYYIETYGK